MLAHIIIIIIIQIMLNKAEMYSQILSYRARAHLSYLCMHAYTIGWQGVNRSWFWLFKLYIHFYLQCMPTYVQLQTEQYTHTVTATLVCAFCQYKVKSEDAAAAKHTGCPAVYVCCVYSHISTMHITRLSSAGLWIM